MNQPARDEVERQYCDECAYAASKGEPVFVDCPNCGIARVTLPTPVDDEKLKEIREHHGRVGLITSRHERTNPYHDKETCEVCYLLTRLSQAETFFRTVSALNDDLNGVIERQSKQVAELTAQVESVRRESWNDCLAAVRTFGIENVEELEAATEGKDKINDEY